MQRVVKRACIRPCREIPPQASNCISIILRCCDLVIVPHTTCSVIQCLHGPHLRLESGTELVRGRTAPRRGISVYYSALRLNVHTSARVTLQPAKPPNSRRLHVQRIRVSKSIPAEGYMRCGRGGHPMWPTPRPGRIPFVPRCIQVLYLCSGRPVMCYLRVLSNLVAAVRVDLPILHAASRPINVPVPLLTEPSPDDHVPETSRHVHGSSSLVLCQAYTIETFLIRPCQCGP